MDGQQGGDPANLAAALVHLAGLEEPPLRFAAGADAVAALEQKANDLLTQADAHRDLSSSLAIEGVSDDIELNGTVALVTGSSSGIGAATARRLADHGAPVALVARRRDRLEIFASEIEKAGGTALVVEADISEHTQAGAAVQQTVDQFGRLDTLVNNAGLMLRRPRWSRSAV